MLQFGISADSIVIGILDIEFKWKQHQTTRDAKIFAGWYFVYSDPITLNKRFDTVIQDIHGSMV